MLNHFDEKVKIDPQNEPYKQLIYKGLFIQIPRLENLLAKQAKNTRRNFAQKVPSIWKKIYVHVTQGALFHVKPSVCVGCSIVTVWLPYAMWKSIGMTRLGRASLPTSGVTQTKEGT